MSQELTAKQHQIIQALLGTGKVEEAARQVGVTPEHIWRLLRSDLDFRLELREAQAGAIASTAARMTAKAPDMVEKLETMADDQTVPAAVRLKAIEAYLNLVTRWIEVFNLDSRISELEKARTEVDGSSTLKLETLEGVVTYEGPKQQDKQVGSSGRPGRSGPAV